MPKLFSHLSAAIVLSTLLASTGYALTEVPKAVKPIKSISVTPLVGGYLFSSSQSLDPGPTYGLKISYDYIGRSIVDSLGLEATFNYVDTKNKLDGQKASALLFRADAIYSLFPRNKWVPFMSIGGGGIFIDRNGVRDNNPFLNIGLGVKYYIQDFLAVRADARQLLVYSNVNTSNNFELTTGLTYYFGKERKKKTPPPPKTKVPQGPAVPRLIEEPPVVVPLQAPPRSIFELLGAAGAAIIGIDTLPLQYQAPIPVLPPSSQAMVYRSPAKVPQPEPLPEQKLEPPPVAAPAEPVAPPEPPPAPAPEPAPAKLPEPEPVPAPAPVAPAPPPEAPAPIVQQEQQPKPRKFVKQFTIEFHFSSDQVRPVYNKRLAQVAQMINSAQDATAEIEGHTDNVGKLEPNIRLSQRRANNVKNELVKYGVNPEKIVTKGYAYTKPKATNKTAEGRQRNRRAVAVITVITTAPP